MPLIRRSQHKKHPLALLSLIFGAALAAHAEDKQDHNLPLMIWYTLEPAVPTDSERALAIAKSTELPRLAQYIARRIAAAQRQR